jgi:hypothetical protein
MAFLIIQNNGTTQALAYNDRQAAIVHAGSSHGSIIVENEADLGVDVLATSTILRIFNDLTGSGLKKFETRAIGVDRLMKILPTVAVPAPEAQPKENTMDEPTTTTTAEPKAPKAKKQAQNQPASAVKFKVGRIRPGTARAQVLALMNGSSTGADIDVVMSFKPGYSLAHFYCLARDCGIGYSFDGEGRVRAEYPEGQSLATAIGAVKEPKAKKDKAEPQAQAAE